MNLYEPRTSFFTATCLWWQPVLENKYHKEIILEAWKRRVQQNKLTIYAFVIMPNHIHCIWKIHDSAVASVFQRDLQKFTARSILKFMYMNDDPLYTSLYVNDADREFQVWERNPLSIELYSPHIFLQKLHYIHRNPLQGKWNLSTIPEEYHYSSARFYATGKDDFGFLTDYRD
jgi:putative transposase